jgi:3-oxoadipate enol-lactonase
VPIAEVNGQRIHYTDSTGPAADGAPLPLILAHGFLMDHRMFVHQVAAFGATRRVITWDERGFGWTEYDGKPFTYWDSANDCLALMDHLGIERAIVGGMSQGGFLSLRVALTAPERVAALVLLDTEAGAYGPEELAAFGPLRDGWLTYGPIDDIANVVAAIILGDEVESARWIAFWRTRPKELFEHSSACLFERDSVVDRLGEITCPALVVHGTADVAITMDKAEALAAGLSGAGPVVPIDGAAHAANLTHPGPVNAAMADFLARV